MNTKAYERVFLSARPLTSNERREFVRWCKQQGITAIIADMAKVIRIAPMNGAIRPMSPVEKQNYPQKPIYE